VAKRAEQRKIQRGTHRIRSQATRELHILAQLTCIALHLAIEKLLQPPALVAARLEVDHPARPRAVHERAIDDDVGEPAICEASQRELTLWLAVLCGEYPAPPLIRCSARQRVDHHLDGAGHFPFRDAVAAQL